jgi:hypothetical protein
MPKEMRFENGYNCGIKLIVTSSMIIFPFPNGLILHRGMLLECGSAISGLEDWRSTSRMRTRREWSLMTDFTAGRAHVYRKATARHWLPSKG